MTALTVQFIRCAGCEQTKSFHALFLSTIKCQLPAAGSIISSIRRKRFLLVKGFDLPARQSDIHADNLQIRFLDIKIFTQQHVSCAIDVIFHQLPLRA